MYQVRLHQFEGPLDLLLFFIRRDELDIYDIPISSIAGEYLEYVRYLEAVDLDGVGDFLYMASVLINIKARMLLPSGDVGDDGEPLDPRQELIERLLEYVRFKEASQNLSEQYDARSEQFARGAASSALTTLDKPGEELVDATVFDLISALKRVLAETPDEVLHQIEDDIFSIEEQQEYLIQCLSGVEKSSFVELVINRSKSFIITTFLAILEMARAGTVVIYFGGTSDDFSLSLPTG
jgi:segregation and condensation protein A